MARAVAVRRSDPGAAGWAPVRPPTNDPPARWDTAGDDTDALWWQWLDAPAGTRPAELTACWYRMDELGMGLALYLPRRLGFRTITIDEETRNVVRLIDLEGWTRRKTGRRLYPDLDRPKSVARSQLGAGRAQLAAAGVLPWAAWPGGELPASWWEEPETLLAMRAWRASAVLVRDELRSWPQLVRGVAGRASGLVGTALRLAAAPGLLARPRSG